MDGAARLVDLVSRCLHSLDGAETGLVVAVSGGPDSVALLRLLIAARAPGTPLIVAHLNHQLRGAESAADEAFVVRLHAALCDTTTHLLLQTGRLDVAALAGGGNVEAAARMARYRWLAEVARAAGVRFIATGHTANDQAETVLHRLLRGAGLQGLRGIAERRPLDDGVIVVRPLLHATRQDVNDYLLTLNQDSREDSSNSDLRYTRNRIRRELLPHLEEKYNPAIISVLGRLAEQAADAHHYLEAEAATLLHEAELPRAGSLLVFDAARLTRAPRLLLRVLFRLVWAREGWPTGRMDFAAWERLAGLVHDEANGGDFPGGVRACRCGRVVQIARAIR